MPKLHFSFLYLIVLTLPLLTVAGCGEKTVTADSATKLALSQNCIDCHASNASPVTGGYITEEWKLSKHNTANKAGCADCHEPHPNHPNTSNCNQCHGGSVVFGPDVTVNPDSAGKCLKCHTSKGGFSATTYDGVTVNTLNTHFKNISSGIVPREYRRLFYTNMSTYVIKTAATATANWVASKYLPNGIAGQYGCRGCHNPHDTSSKIEKLRQWSRSGHGDPTTAPRTNLDFKTRGSSTPANATMGSICVRCHTTTGYINYAKSDFSDVTALAAAGTTDHTKEVTGCNACHDDGLGNAYGYKLRNVLASNPGRSGVPAYFNYSAAKGGNARGGTNVTYNFTFPGAGPSNICVICHMGREAGQIVKMAYLQGVNFTKTGRISAHDFAAGSNLFQESGFEFYTSAAKYPMTSFFHYKAGMGNFQGTGSNGPCITCHMSGSSHTFMPITRNLNGSITGITSTACGKCHPAIATFDMNAPRLETARLGFKAAMAVLRDLIAAKITGVTKDGVTKALSYNSSTNWRSACGGTNTVVAGSGNLAGGADAIGSSAYTMGSAFNYELLYADYGAYVHNPNYIKRLIFDSIDWLQDCSMSTDNGAAVCASIGIIDPLAQSYLCPSNVRP